MDVQITQPAPPDNRLLAMLSGAKNVMNKVETGSYSTGNIDSRAFSEDGINEMVSDGTPRAMAINAGPDGKPINYEKSKMPQAIKEAMLNSPSLAMATPNYTFSLEDVAELVEKPLPTNYKPAAKKQVNENQAAQGQIQVPAGMMLVNESQLQKMIQDQMKSYLLDFMTNTFTKNLKEEVIKKTIGTLIKEGKINITKKTL